MSSNIEAYIEQFYILLEIGLPCPTRWSGPPAGPPGSSRAVRERSHSPGRPPPRPPAGRVGQLRLISMSHGSSLPFSSTPHFLPGCSLVVSTNPRSTLAKSINPLISLFLTISSVSVCVPLTISIAASVTESVFLSNA